MARHALAWTAHGVLIAGLVVAAPSSDIAGRARPDEGGGRFTFALIGDVPYGAEGEARLSALVADINADRRLSFVVHDGDIKNGSSLCSDDMFYDRLQRFNQFNAPLVYVPGDNEWTDCHRASNGGYDPLERLAFLRQLFFPTDRSLGRRTMTLERQSQNPAFALYRENVRWAVHDVLFVGLHVVGSNNNLGRTAAGDEEYAARNAANLVWLRESFQIAADEDHRAVMLFMQANPNFDAAPAERTGFNDLIAALETETLAFGRPVVLVHGDSHYFRIDKPLVGTASRRRIERFTRVETFGEHDNHWVHAAVEPDSENVFRFEPRIVDANIVH